MGRSGIVSEQDLLSYTSFRSPNEWGINTELIMIVALTWIDVVSIDAADVDPNNWTIHPVYIHDHLQGRKLGVCGGCLAPWRL